jgi:hypothetical protein
LAQQFANRARRVRERGIAGYDFGWLERTTIRRSFERRKTVLAALYGLGCGYGDDNVQWSRKSLRD